MICILKLRFFYSMILFFFLISCSKKNSAISLHHAGGWNKDFNLSQKQLNSSLRGTTENGHIAVNPAYNAADSQTCGIQETINQIKNVNYFDNLIGQPSAGLFPNFIKITHPCILSAPIYVSGMQYLTIGGAGPGAESAQIVALHRMPAMFIITGTTGAFSDINLYNMMLMSAKGALSAAFISETNNFYGTIENVDMLPGASSKPPWALYLTGTSEQTIKNIKEIFTKGSFIFANAETGYDNVIDNYNGSNMIIYTQRGELILSRFYFEAGGLYITGVGTDSSSGATVINYPGYMAYGMHLYNMWNVSINNVSFLDNNRGNVPSISLDANCGNIIVINPAQSLNISNASQNPIFVLGNLRYGVDSIVGKYVVLGGNTLQTNTGYFIKGGITADSLTAASFQDMNGFSIIPQSYTAKLFKGKVNVSLPKNFVNTSYHCSANYNESRAKSVFGILNVKIITRNTFAITSYSTSGAINTADSGTIEGICTAQ